ncbi:MAG: hypothetical protein V3S14_13185 [Anaerolineae bacterium]
MSLTESHLPIVTGSSVSGNLVLETPLSEGPYKLKTMSGEQVPFFTIWTGQQISWIGSALAQFALVWWLTERR